MKIEGPTLELAVASALKQANIEVLAGDPGTAVQGQLYFNSTSSKFRGYNGVSWEDIGSGSGGGLTWVAKTGNYTAANGDGILADTDTVGAWELTLPGTPSLGDTVGVIDAKGNFATNNLTVKRNGSNIMGDAADLTVSLDYSNFELVYSGSTLGWVIKTYLVNGAGSGGGGGLTWVAKDANYTASSGDGILADTDTIGAFAVTLPATPSLGDTVGIVDSKANFATNNLTINRNGEKIMGDADNMTLDMDNTNFEFVYSGATLGWIIKTYLVNTGAGGGLNWVARTSNYTAVAGDGILADTDTVGAFTVTLPANPNDGDTVGIVDAKANFGTDNLTVDRNGSNIMGDASNLTLDANNTNFEVVYSGATLGWVIKTYLVPSSFGTLVPSTNDFRLTLESGVAISLSNQNAKTTLYMTPYKGDRIGLYYNGGWTLKSSAEVSLSLSGLTASTVYDIFAYWSGSAVVLEALAWSTITARATAVVQQNGVYVKSGDATRRYIGTIIINASGGQTDDAYTKRFVWNWQNRVKRRGWATNTTVSWTYSTAAYREWNNGTGSIRFEYVCGLLGPLLNVTLRALISGTGSGYVSAGFDSTTVSAFPFSYIDNYFTRAYGYFNGGVQSTIGYHYIAPIEYATAGTITMNGAGGVATPGYNIEVDWES